MSLKCDETSAQCLVQIHDQVVGILNPDRAAPMKRNIAPNQPGIRGMSVQWCGAAATAVLLLAASCAPLPPTSSVVIPPVPGGAARIWIYQNDGPYETSETPYLRLNGQIAGILPNGALYRDVPPGHYAVTVDSYGVPYPYQFVEFDLGAGQEAFVKVLSMRNKVGGPDAMRTHFFTELVPPDIARPAIAVTPFYGSS